MVYISRRKGLEDNTQFHVTRPSLMAHGLSEVEGVSYCRTFSPVSQHGITPSVSLCSHLSRDLNIHDLDIYIQHSYMLTY